MKLAEILREDNASMILSNEQIEWWKKHAKIETSNAKQLPYDLDELIEKHFKTGVPFKTRKKLYSFYLDYGHHEHITACPITAEQIQHYFPQKSTNGIRIYQGIFSADSKMPKFNDLSFVSFHPNIVESLKPLIDLKPNDVVISTTTDYQCGLLPLLKLNKFSLVFTNTHTLQAWDKKTHEIEAALKIVQKHMKEKDVVACQTELIDADLEEFAKS